MRYAILSDIHANADALKVVLDHIPDSLPIWFLGDAVGYYPDAVEVLNQLLVLQEHGRLPVWLKGNHDYCAYTADKWGYIERTALKAIELTTAALPNRYKTLLAELPETLEHVLGTNISVAHGSPFDPLWHYQEGPIQAEQAAKVCPTPVCLVGHTHCPRKIYSYSSPLGRSWKVQELFHVPDNTFTYDEDINHKVFLNPGSVGQPRDGFSGKENDGYPHAAYAILDTEQRTFTVYRVKYRIEDISRRTYDWLKQTDLEEHLIQMHLQRLQKGH